MRFGIQDRNTGKQIEVTDLVIDTLEQGEQPAWTDSLVAQAIDIAADIARETFGHDNIDAGRLVINPKIKQS